MEEVGTELRAMQVAVESQQGGQAEVVAPTTVPEPQVSAEIAVETPAAEVTPATTPTEEAVATPPSSNEPYNYWVDLESKTEGLVKDDASLSALIERSKTLQAEKEELERTAFKPANEYIAKLNEMTAAGANPDQINAFVKLNSYGDLSQLSAIDAKVTELVLTKGYSETIARHMVNRDFNLDQFDEDIPEQKIEADIMREQLRIEGLNSIKNLQEYKKELSTVRNVERENAEQAKLKELADLSTYNQTVEREAVNIAKHFPEKLNYEFKIGERDVKYEDVFDKNFRETELPKYVNEYFRDSMDPINQESITQAYSFAMGEYLKANDEARIKRAYESGDSAGYERAVNVYENRSGLPKAPENQVVLTNESGQSEFLRKMVGR